MIAIARARPPRRWYQAYGTASEHDGSLFLTSPGAAYPTPLGTIPIVSIAAAQPNSWVHDGGGSFSATAFWEPILPLVPVDVALAFAVTDCGFDSRGQSLRCRE